METCDKDCYYLYPLRLSNDKGYRCHCHGSCPAWCINCVNDCKKVKYDWCQNFVLKEEQ